MTEVILGGSVGSVLDQIKRTIVDERVVELDKDILYAILCQVSIRCGIKASLVRIPRISIVPGVPLTLFLSTQLNS